jgi:shikimate kinase
MITELSSAAHPERLLWEAQQERWHVRPLNLKQGVVLIGHSGSGKTSLGQDLAQRLGLAFVDLDHAIEKKTNQSISELFENQGEATFRNVEYQVALENLKPGQVIALGGGAWHQPDLRLHIKSLSLPVVVLAEPPRRCWTRLQSSTSRPLARSESDFLARCAQRAVDLQDLDEIYSCGRSTDDLANLLTYD